MLSSNRTTGHLLLCSTGFLSEKALSNFWIVTVLYKNTEESMSSLLLSREHADKLDFAVLEIKRSSLIIKSCQNYLHYKNRQSKSTGWPRFLFQNSSGFVLPESNRGNPTHERVGRDALQVEQAPVEKQQQDDVLTEHEALSTLPNRWNILENKNIREIPTHWLTIIQYFTVFKILFPHVSNVEQTQGNNFVLSVPGVDKCSHVFTKSSSFVVGTSRLLITVMVFIIYF